MSWCWQARGILQVGYSFKPEFSTISFLSRTPCRVYEEAKEHDSVGFSEEGEEFDEEASG